MIRYAIPLVLVAACAQAESHTTGVPVDQGEKNVPAFEPAFENQTRAPALAEPGEVTVSVVAGGLERPWGIEVLPEGGYLVTERPGRLRLISADGTLGDPISGVPQVLAQQQGGLLDVALAEDFETSRRIYLTYSKRLGPNSATAAATGIFSEDGTALSEVEDIFVQSPPSPSPMHYGSRVVPHDGQIYITTGEHFTNTERLLAQDPQATYGKTMRVAAGGGRPEILTLGHRNVQGADIDPETGDLWTLEHGPAGGDELNRIEPGANYGWPVVSYGRNYTGPLVGSGAPRAEGFVEPRYYWDPVIAPGGFAFYDGTLFDWSGDVVAGSLNPGGVVRLTRDGNTITGEARYLTVELGRVRDIEIDRDGAILALSGSNGTVVRITPAN